MKHTHTVSNKELVRAAKVFFGRLCETQSAHVIAMSSVRWVIKDTGFDRAEPLERSKWRRCSLSSGNKPPEVGFQ